MTSAHLSSSSLFRGTLVSGHPELALFIVSDIAITKTHTSPPLLCSYQGHFCL